MSRFINSIVLGLVSFIVLLSIFWYVVEVRHENRIAIQDIEPRWGASDLQATDIVWKFKLDNTHKSLAQLVALQYEFGIDDYQLQEGSRNLTVRVAAESTGEFDLPLDFKSDFTPFWVKAHAEGGKEQSWITLTGIATFQVNQGRVEVPFDVKRDWRSTLAADIAGSLKGCDQSTATVCVSNAEAAWDTSGNTVLATQVFLRNQAEQPMNVSDVRAELYFNAIPVAQASALGPLTLEADQSAGISLRLLFNDQSLIRWWPKHVQACEASPVYLHLEYTVDPGGGAQTARIAQDFPASTFQSRFVCGE